MKYNYRIIDYSDLGIPNVEVHGERFHYQDLYELVGRQQFMTTLKLMEGSTSYDRYGENVLGLIYYSFEQIQELEDSVANGNDLDVAIIRIDAPDINISLSDRGDLKYGGIEVKDIESLSFLPYKKEIERHDTGEKKVPNVIEIEVDCSDIDPDILYQNYVASKINSNVELIHFEKEKFVGITLGLNDGRIDSRLLEYLGFSKNSIKNNLNLWCHLYKVRERRATLSDVQKNSFSEIKNILMLEKIEKLVKELKASGVDAKELAERSDAFKNVMDSVVSFAPDILMHGKRQVYWDIDSYIHIVMRHIKDYQVGTYKEKTPFPYKTEDLKILIEKVIRSVGDEIESHFSKGLDNDFNRHGKMGIVFNGDHYNLRIEPRGCLTQFHPIVKSD